MELAVGAEGTSSMKLSNWKSGFNKRLEQLISPIQRFILPRAKREQTEDVREKSWKKKLKVHRRRLHRPSRSAAAMAADRPSPT